MVESVTDLNNQIVLLHFRFREEDLREKKERMLIRIEDVTWEIDYTQLLYSRLLFRE